MLRCKYWKLPLNEYKNWHIHNGFQSSNYFPLPIKLLNLLVILPIFTFSLKASLRASIDLLRLFISSPHRKSYQYVLPPTPSLMILFYFTFYVIGIFNRVNYIYCSYGNDLLKGKVVKKPRAPTAIFKSGHPSSCYPSIVTLTNPPPSL